MELNTTYQEQKMGDLPVFILSKRIIDNFLYGIIQGNEARPCFPPATGELRIANGQTPTYLGQRLLDTNLDALEQFYQKDFREHYNPIYVAVEHKKPVHPVRVYKDARCLYANCYVGTVKKSKLLEDVYVYINALANAIVVASPKYKSLKWG